MALQELEEAVAVVVEASVDLPRHTEPHDHLPSTDLLQDFPAAMVPHLARLRVTVPLLNHPARTEHLDPQRPAMVCQLDHQQVMELLKNYRALMESLQALTALHHSDQGAAAAVVVEESHPLMEHLHMAVAVAAAVVEFLPHMVCPHMVVTVVVEAAAAVSLPRMAHHLMAVAAVAEEEFHPRMEFHHMVVAVAEEEEEFHRLMERHLMAVAEVAVESLHPTAPLALAHLALAHSDQEGAFPHLTALLDTVRVDMAQVEAAVEYHHHMVHLLVHTALLRLAHQEVEALLVPLDQEFRPLMVLRRQVQVDLEVESLVLTVRLLSVLQAQEDLMEVVPCLVLMVLRHLAEAVQDLGVVVLEAVDHRLATELPQAVMEPQVVAAEVMALVDIPRVAAEVTVLVDIPQGALEAVTVQVVQEVDTVLVVQVVILLVALVEDTPQGVDMVLVAIAPVEVVTLREVQEVDTVLVDLAVIPQEVDTVLVDPAVIPQAEGDMDLVDIPLAVLGVVIALAVLVVTAQGVDTPQEEEVVVVEAMDQEATQRQCQPLSVRVTTLAADMCTKTKFLTQI
ncbi:uncharacterized protein LOC123869235 isoform X7 [Maniola jurtina]|uniref:uncharacterized protein LOC123869235 isoform X7 n=1 Tax=Maniola jurtina TaxID=191418 RepID=UPI001E68A7AF|nr:uncharacterized protein LOC123869235 isoform X7 [Maniola jurtina]